MCRDAVRKGSDNLNYGKPERAAGKYGGTLPENVEIWTIEGIIKR